MQRQEATREHGANQLHRVAKMFGCPLEHPPLVCAIAFFLFPLGLFPFHLELIFEIFPDIVEIAIDL